MIDDGFDDWRKRKSLTNVLSQERIEVILNALYTGSEQMAKDLIHEGLERAYRAQLEHKRMCNR